MFSKMLTVDVIIPVFNGAKYIERCVESVLKNSEECFRYHIAEVRMIIVDDGSTDRTSIVLESLHLSKNEAIILHQANSGVAAARNLGLENSDGDFILFLDADDWLPEYAIKNLLENALIANADIVIGKSHYYLGGIPITSTSETWHKLEPGVIDPHKNNFLVEITPGVRAKLFRSNMVRGCRFPLERIKWEDLALIPALIAKANKILYIDEDVYNYTIHINTTVKDFLFHCNVLDIIKSLDLLKGNLVESGVFDEYSREYHSMLVLHTLFRAENIVTWINASKSKKDLTRQLIFELAVRYPDWRDDPVLVDPKLRYEDPFFNFLLKKLYL